MNDSFDAKRIRQLVTLFKGAKVRTTLAHKKFVFVISMVPRGRVATYGQVARLAGHPGHARQVVWTLHSSSKKYQMPWHRIINAQGKIGHVNERHLLRQQALLRKEGIESDHRGRVDLRRFLWEPHAILLRKNLKKLK